MPYQDVNQTVLQIVNKVLGRLGLDEVSTLDENKLSIVATELLNDVMTDISQFFDWPQMFTETSVLAVSSVQEYKINVDAKSIYEIAVSGQTSPLYPIPINDILRLNRMRHTGTPRQFAIVRASGNAPYIRVHPVPVEPVKSFEVSYYTKPLRVRASAGDGSIVFNFPATMIQQGLYAQMLLEESGGKPTPETAAAAALFAKMKQETLNQFVFDISPEVYIVPVR